MFKGIIKRIFKNNKIIKNNKVFNYNLKSFNNFNIYINIFILFCENGFIYIYYGNYNLYSILNYYGPYSIFSNNNYIFEFSDIIEQLSYYKYENNILSFISSNSIYKSWNISLINKENIYDLCLISLNNNLNFSLGFVDKNNNLNYILLQNSRRDNINYEFPNNLIDNYQPNILQYIYLKKNTLKMNEILISLILRKYFIKKLIKENKIPKINPFFINNKYTFLLLINLDKNLSNDKIKKTICIEIKKFFKFN